MVGTNKYHLGVKMKKSEMGGAFGTHEQSRDAHRDFARENWGKETIR